MALPGALFADQVKYDVVLARDGKVVASPTFLAEFGKPAAIEVGGMMRVEAVTDLPDKEGNSATTVKFQLFENGKLRPPEESWMLVDFTRPATFEYSVPGTNAKFTFKQALVKGSKK